MSGPDTDYDPRVWLERSGILFLNRGQSVAAAGAFMRFLEREPGHSNAWYGLGNALFTSEVHDFSILRDAAATLKRSLVENPQNEMAQELLDGLVERDLFSPDQLEEIAAFGTDFGDLEERLGFHDQTFAEAMKALSNPPERMQIVMWLSVFDEPAAIEILIAALDDEFQHVRMAALKRLRGDDPRIEVKLRKLVSSDWAHDSEPYLSMALKRLARASGDDGHWSLALLESLES